MKTISDVREVGSITLKATGDWEYTEDMGKHGRLDTFIDVEGHPEFDAIRYFFAPGDWGEAMEWQHDGQSSREPIPEDIRTAAMELVILDMTFRLYRED